MKGKKQFLLSAEFILCSSASAVNPPLTLLSVTHPKRHPCYWLVCGHCHRGALQHLKGAAPVSWGVLWAL